MDIVPVPGLREVLQSDDYAFAGTIPDDDYGWYEWQAYAFAGLALVPRDSLRGSAERHAGRVTERVQQAGIAVAAVWDTIWDLVLKEVAHDFEVSVDVIQRRVEKDGLPYQFHPHRGSLGA